MSRMDHILLMQHESGRWSLVVGRWSLVVGRWSLVDYSGFIVHLSISPFANIFQYFVDYIKKNSPHRFSKGKNYIFHLRLLRLKANPITLIIAAPMHDTLQLLLELLPSSYSALLTVIFSGVPPRSDALNASSSSSSSMS